MSACDSGINRQWNWAYRHNARLAQTALRGRSCCRGVRITSRRAKFHHCMCTSHAVGGRKVSTCSLLESGSGGGFVELVVQGKRQMPGTPQYGSTYFGGHFERLVTGLMGDGSGCKKWCVVVRVGGLQSVGVVYRKLLRGREPRLTRDFGTARNH